MFKRHFCIAFWLLVASNATVYAQDEPPFVKSISITPSPHFGGNKVSILGDNFQTGVTVTFGDIPSTDVSLITSSIMKALTPAHPAGIVDLTVTNPDGQAVTVKNGFEFVFTRFGLPIFLATKSAAVDLFSADLDGDGDSDLVVSSRQSDIVSVFLNNGDGTFALRTDYATGHTPSSVFIADLDGDGDNDLAVTISRSDNVSVLLNSGDGTFGAKVNFSVGDQPNSVFIADLNRDGINDLAVTNGNGVSVLMNNGDGTFAPKVDYRAGSQPAGLTSADLDGDGDNDLAVANSYRFGGGNSVSVLMNSGDGTFAPKVDYDAGVRPASVFSADVDADGDQDLVTANAANNVTVLWNWSDIPVTTVVTEQTELSADVPKTYSLPQNYPNPFNPQTVIHYELPVEGHVELSVFNLMGQKVATLVDGYRTAGGYSLVWDGKDDNQKSLASGVYLYRMETERFVKTRKLLLLR